jgi:hypothetical protein
VEEAASEHDDWITDSPPPALSINPAPKISFKRPVASPAEARPQVKPEVLAVSQHAAGDGARFSSVSGDGDDSALHIGLSAVLRLISHSEEFKLQYNALYLPVSTLEFKDYPKVVKQPKCIKEIAVSISSRRYDSCDAFLSDLMLISSNCEAFSRSRYIEYNEDLVFVAWGCFVEVSGCFFKHAPSAIEQLDLRRWSVQQRALFKIFALDYGKSDFKFRVDKSVPSYYKIVKKPICLAEVQMHAASSGSTVTSVTERMKLLCSNCQLFCASKPGAEYAHLLHKVNLFLAVLNELSGSTATSAQPPAAGLLRIKSAASASSGKPPLLPSSRDSVCPSDAVSSSATIATTPRDSLPSPAPSSNSIGYYVELLAERFPSFVPELKLVMDPLTYKAYKLKVRRPLSISMIRDSLQNGPYSIVQFAADVQAIGSNCISFWTAAGGQPQLVAEAHALMKQVAHHDLFCALLV